MTAQFVAMLFGSRCWQEIRALVDTNGAAPIRMKTLKQIRNLQPCHEEAHDQTS